MSVKKEEVEVEVPGSTQSAAARRSAEAELSTLVEKHAPEHVRLVRIHATVSAKASAHRL